MNRPYYINNRSDAPAMSSPTPGEGNMTDNGMMMNGNIPATPLPTPSEGGMVNSGNMMQDSNIPVTPLPNPGEGGTMAPGTNGSQTPGIPLPNPGEGGPVFPGNGSNVPVTPLPNPGEGGPVFPGNGSNIPVIPLPNPGEGGSVFPGNGSNIPVIPLPNPGEGGPVASGPVNTIITVFPRPIIPCFFCNSDRFGNVRFLNAATGYNPFLIYINRQLIVNSLGYAQISQYGRVSAGYQTITVAGLNGYIYIQKQVQITMGSTMTIAIVNTASGLDLTQISDVPCATPGNTACFRACNLSFNSGPLDVVLNNGYVRFNDIRFQEVTPFSRIASGNYNITVSRSNMIMPRYGMPEVLVSSSINAQTNTLYTLYIFNWNTSPDAIRTMIVEDRR